MKDNHIYIPFDKLLLLTILKFALFKENFVFPDE